MINQKQCQRKLRKKQVTIKQSNELKYSLESRNKVINRNT